MSDPRMSLTVYCSQTYKSVEDTRTIADPSLHSFALQTRCVKLLPFSSSPFRGVRVEVEEGGDKMIQEKMHQNNSIFRTEKKELSHIDLCHKICPVMSEMSL